MLIMLSILYTRRIPGLLVKGLHHFKIISICEFLIGQMMESIYKKSLREIKVLELIQIIPGILQEILEIRSSTKDIKLL
ncbi:hypothetical protein D0T11_15240 [Hymenobacter rubripertinctus]|uniref:Uncharacterized protein n=1 Tax=Hymenobacter rubripertinctus TaxID=2029981 RepID=A0A418QRM4_9BACT|nr:hypothetical protein D0T11_15240 [Hymenobacter rubripertinctus]